MTTINLPNAVGTTFEEAARALERLKAATNTSWTDAQTTLTNGLTNGTFAWKPEDIITDWLPPRRAVRKCKDIFDQ